MARTRDVKPAVFDSERFGRISGDAFRLWVALLQLADRDGYVEDRPGRWKRYAFGYRDDVTEAGVGALRDELAGAEALTLIVSDNGDKWLSLRNFCKHVRVHPKELSRFKSPGSAEPKCGPTTPNRGPAPDCGRKKKEVGRTKTEEGRPKKGGRLDLAGFGDFWARYPLKVGKERRPRRTRSASGPATASLVSTPLARSSRTHRRGSTSADGKTSCRGRVARGRRSCPTSKNARTSTASG
jgi:hypothetical protein